MLYHYLWILPDSDSYLVPFIYELSLFLISRFWGFLGTTQLAFSLTFRLFPAFQDILNPRLKTCHAINEVCFKFSDVTSFEEVFMQALTKKELSIDLFSLPQPYSRSGPLNLPPAGWMCHMLAMPMSGLAEGGGKPWCITWCRHDLCSRCSDIALRLLRFYWILH